MNDRFIFPALYLAIGIALAGLFMAYAIFESRSNDRFVTVKGLAEQTVKSDQATWEIQFNAVDDNLTNLYQSIAASQNAIKAFLEAQGFETKNIAFQPISITDNQSNAYNNNEKIKRYTANAGVSLTTNQVDKVLTASQKTGDLLQKGVVITSSNVNFQYTGLNTIKPAMLDQATNNAKEAAESFSKNSHSALGNIRNANQGLFTISGLSSNYSSDASVMKKVRVVTTVQYYLK